MKKLLFLAFVAICFIYSCTARVTKPVTVAEPIKTAIVTVDTFAQGKSIYESSCAKCHDLPVPTKYTAEKWVGIMNWMAPKAKLTDEQHKLVYNYIVSVK